VIRDSMPCDPMQGQSLRGLKVAKMADFKVNLLHWYACNYDTTREYLNFNWTVF